jgi:hypothetical protein
MSSLGSRKEGSIVGEAAQAPAETAGLAIFGFLWGEGAKNPMRGGVSA